MTPATLLLCLLVGLLAVHERLGFPTGESAPKPRNMSPKDVYIDVERLLKEVDETTPPRLSDAPAASADADHTRHRRNHKVPTDKLKSGEKDDSHKKNLGKGSEKKGLDKEKRHNADKHKEPKVDMKIVPVTAEEPKIKPSKLVKTEVTPEHVNIVVPVSYSDYQGTQPAQPGAIPVFYNGNQLPSNVQYYPSQYMNGNPISMPQNSPSYKQDVPYTVLETPTLSWTAIIEYPGLDPIYISDKNYTDNADVEVKVHPPSDHPQSHATPIAAPAPPPVGAVKHTGIPQAHVSSQAEYPAATGIKPIIWDNGVPYVPYQQPTVYYQPPSPEPIRYSQGLQQWTPTYYTSPQTGYYPPATPYYSSQPYYTQPGYQTLNQWGYYTPAVAPVSYNNQLYQHAVSVPPASGRDFVEVNYYPYSGPQAPVAAVPLPGKKPEEAGKPSEPEANADEDDDDNDNDDDDEDDYNEDDD